MANPKRENLLKAARKLAVKAGGWVDPFLKVAALLSGLFSILLLWLAKDEFHLVVWVEEQVIVYPAKSTENLSLPLEFDKRAANSVQIVKAKVVNYGKQIIGKPETLWDLYLQGPIGSSLVLFKNPTVTPETLMLAKITRGTTPNVLKLQLGALQPRSTIDLHLLLVNASPAPPREIDLKIDSSLPGLSREITRVKPVERLLTRIYPSVFLFMFLALAIEGVPLAVAAAKKRASDWAKLRVWIGRGLGAVLLAAFASYLLSYGLAYVVSWFL
jgi:hypothetical protein